MKVKVIPEDQLDDAFLDSEVFESESTKQAAVDYFAEQRKYVDYPREMDLKTLHRDASGAMVVTLYRAALAERPVAWQIGRARRPEFSEDD